MFSLRCRYCTARAGKLHPDEHLYGEADRVLDSSAELQHFEEIGQFSEVIANAVHELSKHGHFRTKKALRELIRIIQEIKGGIS